MGLSNEWANKWRQWVAAMDQRSVDMLQGLAGSRRARGLVVGGAAAVLLGLAGWSLRPLPDDGEGLSQFCRSTAGGNLFRANACYDRLLPVIEELVESRKGGDDVQKIGDACLRVAERSGWDACSVTVSGLFSTRRTTIEFSRAVAKPLVVARPGEGQ
ncbi:hypothetical protein [Xanthomonas perforans]|uniref:hypothetical protein n=1 Tax=Xanthomonas perforans TaxID=442694 RepID=UPI001192E287|nr:hypothetical protein [Xanthomonas perforans]MDC9651009.1 hypothetical protein [Xanthomonas perforans]MDC9656493.1 hypothetical protein [Xanthomonas perforans]MDC9676595.1 hypothetical protein [Xanthomonas perforans]MDC9680490.1 hypothetical protein [Xanthomonas perforans]MDC9684706.1 hypothetical protein [Xanthomonas perforans]